MSDQRVLLVIKWVDSVSAGGVWTPREDLPTDGMEVESIGWLVAEDDDSVTIAAHWSVHAVGGDMTIPKVAITDQWEVSF